MIYRSAQIFLLLKCCRVLIQAGANINHVDQDGWTPLHGAAHWGQQESCKILTEALCDMDVKDRGGQTAADVADDALKRLMKELYEKQQGVSVSLTTPHRWSDQVFMVLMVFSYFQRSVCMFVFVIPVFLVAWSLCLNSHI